MMDTLSPKNKTSPYAAMWQNFQPMLSQGIVPQAILFVGPGHLNLLQFAAQFVNFYLCSEKSACGVCSECRLLQEASHPDVLWLQQEAAGKAIKIDQVRAIQEDIYKSPQRTSHRFVVINPADKLNMAASNALLKVLEEPPEHTTFLLLAEQIDAMLPTIRSRCQKYVFAEEIQSDYLSIAAQYSDELPRAKLFQGGEEILNQLIALIDGRESPCEVAIKWADYELDDLLWWLYLVNAQIIHRFFYKPSSKALTFAAQIERLSQQAHPSNLFSMNDKLCALRAKINNNITVNPTLTIEDILIDYKGIAHAR